MAAAIAPPDPPLVGGDVRLRPWLPEDAATIARIVADPEIPRWTYLPRGMTEDRARYWIGRGHEAAATGRGLPLAIVDAGRCLPTTPAGRRAPPGEPDAAPGATPDAPPGVTPDAPQATASEGSDRPLVGQYL